MSAIAIGLLWAAYTVGLYAWILSAGYNISFQQMFSRTWPPKGN